MDGKSDAQKFSSTPSGLRKPPAVPGSQSYAKPQGPTSNDAPAQSRSPVLSRLAFIVAVISLLVNAYLVFSFFSIKSDLKAISADFEGIKNKDVQVSIPIKATVSLKKDIQIGELLPGQIEIPLAFSVPVSGSVTGISQQGQPLSFSFNNQSLPVKTSVFANVSVQDNQQSVLTINEQIPVDTTIQTTIKTNVLYQNEMQDLSNRLKNMAN